MKPENGVVNDRTKSGGGENWSIGYYHYGVLSIMFQVHASRMMKYENEDEEERKTSENGTH